MKKCSHQEAAQKIKNGCEMRGRGRRVSRVECLVFWLVVFWANPQMVNAELYTGDPSCLTSAAVYQWPFDQQIPIKAPLYNNTCGAVQWHVANRMDRQVNDMGLRGQQGFKVSQALVCWRQHLAGAAERMGADTWSISESLLQNQEMIQIDSINTLGFVNWKLLLLLSCWYDVGYMIWVLKNRYKHVMYLLKTNGVKRLFVYLLFGQWLQRKKKRLKRVQLAKLKRNVKRWTRKSNRSVRCVFSCRFVKAARKRTEKGFKEIP